MCERYGMRYMQLDCTQESNFGEDDDPFSRTKLLFGAEAMRRLKQARVAVFGVGGVGGYAAEALARSGVGTLDLIDSDTVCLSNLNRQIIATLDTVGRYKVDVMAERILSINPYCLVHPYRRFFMPENASEFDFKAYSYVVDAVDTVTAKLALVMAAQKAGVPVISCMGAGNKLDPTRFEVADIYQTSVCPLARVMRRELKKRGVESLKVVYSKEETRRPVSVSKEKRTRQENTENMTEQFRHPVRQKEAPGSNAFVPAAAGLILAGAVVCDLAGVYD